MAIPKAVKEALFIKQSGRCMYCGRKFALEVTEVEHKTPRTRGGTDRVSNLHITCRRCNGRKGDMTDGEFRKAYSSVGLLPSRQAKGKPTSPPIPLKKFDAASDAIGKRKATNARKRRRRDAASY